MSGRKTSLLNSGATSILGKSSSAPSWKVETGPLIYHSKKSSSGSLENPFAAIFEEIRKANEAGLSHAALALTLTIPDVCAALISPKGKSSGPAYAAWFDAQMPSYLGHLSGKDLYSIRSGFLHEARSDRPHMQWERVIFNTAGMHRMTLEGNRFNGVRLPDTYVINVALFGAEVIEAAERWFEENRDDPAVIANSPFVVRHREEVMLPAIGGISGIC